MNKRLTNWMAIAVVLASAASVGAQHPLDSWVQRDVPGPNTNLESVAFGNGVFVAVGGDSFVARSADGASWTTSTAGAYGNLARVRFLNGQFLAVGSSDKMLFSTDGAIWTSNTLPSAGFGDVSWGNGVYVLAGSGTYASTNGVDWVRTHPILTPLVGAPYETALDSVVFGNNVFVALISTGPVGGPSVYSTNGMDWISGGNAPTSAGGPLGSTELLFADGVFLASAGSDIHYQGVYLSTNNGASWSEGFAGTQFGGGLALASGEGYYISVHSVFNQPLVFSSTNRTSWALRHRETIAASPRGAAFGNGTFVVVGADGANASYILQSGNVSGVPSIFQEPQDRGAVAMNPANFSVQAAGAPPLAYQWYHNDAPLANATNTTYNIASVQTSDSGGYHVVITNSFGSVTSRVAQLTVSFLDLKMYAGIQILGVVGRTYRIDATPATGPLNWQTLTNLVLPASPYIWIDYSSPTAASQVYRAAELP